MFSSTQGDRSVSLQGGTIALVGRPNVGKSTLFNRLIGARKTVVSSVSGTTRDRVYGCITWRGVPLRFIDTGGVEFGKVEGLAAVIQQHIHLALQEADEFVLVCDAQKGLTPADELIMAAIRKTGRPIALAANKLDHDAVAPADFFSLGTSHVHAVSALHGRGVGELLDDLVERLPRAHLSVSGSTGRESQAHRQAASHQTPAIAIVGRQNVGKSSLLNAWVRQERVIVSEVPGTTRDAVDTYLMVNDIPLALIDTAGLRHRRKVTTSVDFFSISRTLGAIRRADVAAVVLDATQGVTRDDRRIVAHVCQVGCGLVLLVNKWDTIKGGSERRLTQAIQRELPAASFAPIIAISAKTGFQVARSLTRVLEVLRASRRGLADAECLTLLQQAWARQPSPRIHGRTVRLRQARWVPGRPPRIEVVVSPINRLPLPYERYLLKQVHAHPSLSGIPIRLAIRTLGRSDSRRRPG